MIKAVFDTVIFVRGLINPHSFCGQFFFKYNHKFQLFLSKPIVKEILEVIERPEIKRKYKTGLVNRKKILKVLSLAKNVRIKRIEKICRDEKDDIFLATALAAKTNYLVSKDEDLLCLKKYKEIKIINSSSFLKVLKKPANNY